MSMFFDMLSVLPIAISPAGLHKIWAAMPDYSFIQDAPSITDYAYGLQNKLDIAEWYDLTPDFLKRLFFGKKHKDLTERLTEWYKARSAYQQAIANMIEAMRIEFARLDRIEVRKSISQLDHYIILTKSGMSIQFELPLNFFCWRDRPFGVLDSSRYDDPNHLSDEFMMALFKLERRLKEINAETSS